MNPSETTAMHDQVAELAKTHDGSNMARVIEQGPGQIAYALSDGAFPEMPAGPFQRAIVCGMGGSALPVDVLNDVFSRTYGLPPGVDTDTFVIASSFSGNTEETLDAAEALPVGNANLAAVCAGGKLARLAKERNAPLVRIPKEREPEGFQPRSATGYMVTYMARMLEGAGLLTGGTKRLEALVPFLESLKVRADAERLAEAVGDRIPVFYTDPAHELSVARIAKIKQNEHAKRPAFFGALPEINHNEMVGYTLPYGEYLVIYLKNPDSHPRIHQRFDTMRSVFADRDMGNVAFHEWEMPGASTLERVFAAMVYADWCAYTLALLARIDPSPVDLVEGFKKRLAE